MQAYLVLRDSGLAPWNMGIIGISKRRLYEAGNYLAPVYSQIESMMPRQQLELQAEAAGAVIKAIGDIARMFAG